MGDVTLWLTLVGVLVGAVAAYYQVRSFIDTRKRRAESRSPEETTETTSRRRRGISDELLRYFWEYPLKGESESSWAVKESAVFRGDLRYAREKPGLGAAIVSTEFAIENFGNAAASRIDGCVSWALARVDSAAPHCVLAEIIDPVTSAISRRPDFRHTLAFAVVLARSGRLLSHLEGYLAMALSSQQADGGWPPGEGVTVSELFTVLYGFELVDICMRDDRLPDPVRAACATSRIRAAGWLTSNVMANGMWTCGVLKEFNWDELVSTAWVLHRILPIQVNVPGWGDCLSRAALAMVERAANPEYWKPTSETARFRAEARAAAASSVLVQADHFSPALRERVGMYLQNWRVRVGPITERLPESEWDLSTAVFCLQGIEAKSGIKAAASRLLPADQPNQRWERTTPGLTPVAGPRPPTRPVH